MAFFIRRATAADAPDLSRICLLTGDAGQSAEALHKHPEMLGLVYALPYVDPALESVTGGFVLVRPSSDGADGADGADEERVVGYILYTTDSRRLEDLAEEHYWPALRARFPLLPKDADEDARAKDKEQFTKADAKIRRLFHRPSEHWAAPPAAVAFSPAHMHIDLLPEAQRQGWGRRLVDSVVRELRGRTANDGKPLEGLWIGMDPRNTEADKFYRRLGYRPMQGAPATDLGLRFEDWEC